MSTAGAPHSLECPRCGHLLGPMADEADRRGETHGHCGECGLEIEWRRLRADTVATAWLVESQTSRMHIARRAFATLVRTARPFRFWGSIDLALRLSRRRLLVFVLAVLVALHLCASTYRVTMRESSYWSATSATVERAGTMGRVLLAFASPMSEFDGRDVVYETSGMTFEQDTLPLFVKSIPFLLRAAVPLRPSFWVVTTSPAGGNTTSLIRGNAPDLLTTALKRATLVFLPAALLSPLVLLLLPVSLRRARVRPRHFVRLMAYTTALSIPIVACIYLTDALMRIFAVGFAGRHLIHLYPIAAHGGPNPILLLLIAVSALTAVWLTAAASRYLRLPHPRGVGIACTSISMLLACIVFASI